MRIAVLTNDYPPHTRGGAGIVAETYVRELERRGHEVRVFCEQTDWRRVFVFWRFLLHLRDLLPRLHLVQDIFSWKPEILITHNVTGCGFATPSMIQKRGIRWIHFLHDVQLFEPSGKIMHGESYPRLRRLWRWKWAFLRRISLGRPDVVISPTRWLLDFHKRYGFFRGIHSVVIPNPLTVVVGASRSRFGAAETSLLYVGRLDRDKGVHLLLEAWKKISPRPYLVVIGEGEFHQELLMGDDKHLILLGSRSHSDVLGYMQEADLVVVPSLVLENQPTVILEALALGCKVIATAVGGIPETLGKAGWLVQPGDAEALKEAIEEARQQSMTTEMQQERTAILARHGIETAISELEKVFHSSREKIQI